MQEKVGRNPKIETAPMQDEFVLFDPDANKFCTLNRTAAFLWSQLETPHTPEQLAVEVCRSFAGVASQQALSDVEETIQEMRSLGLVIPQG